MANSSININTEEPRIFSRFADTNGDGTGTKQATGDYSGAAEEFFIAPAAGVKMYVSRLIVSIEDTNGMIADEYGNLASGLTNGVDLLFKRGNTTVIDFCDGIPIKTNAEWAIFCYDADLKTWGNGNEILAARWTIAKSGQYQVLDGNRSEKLVVQVNDDLTGLVDHRFMFQGYETGAGINRA